MQSQSLSVCHGTLEQQKFSLFDMHVLYAVYKYHIQLHNMYTE